MPETPPLQLASDYEDRTREKSGRSFRGVPDRQKTIENVKAALAALGDDVSKFDDESRLARHCFGLGLGYLTIEILFEAMERERTLERDKFWNDVQRAIHCSETGEAIDQLRSAAECLKTARDTLYSSDIHWLDFARPSINESNQPINWIATGRELESTTIGPLEPRDPDASEPPRLEICGGPFLERADDLLPLESQLWNLKRGHTAVRKLNAEPGVFVSRMSAWHAQSPQVLQRAGYSKCVFVPFDDAKLPSHRAAVVQWPASDGKQVEAFCRAPVPADDPQTGFHLAHYLHQTIMSDSTAVIALIRTDKPAANWHDDWFALNELGPVLGKPTTISHFLRDATVGEYATAATADDFAIDHLDRLVTANDPRPVSGIARHWRLRRHADAGWTWLALVRSLGGTIPVELSDDVRRFEETIETNGEVDVTLSDQAAAAPLVERLLSRANENSPGLLLLNPCGFARRVALERDDFSAAPAVEGPVKAAQRDADGTVRVVAEVPALGFSWIPRGDPSLAPRTPKFKMADGNVVRNEFFEAEIDKETGGLRAFRDLKTRDNRVGQQLVFQPGSVMHAKSIAVTTSGSAMGEIVSEGALLDEHKTVIATFRQHFRAWLGRPLLEIQIEIFPERPPQGAAWHAYFGARFAWRDERATLLRGNAGIGSVTTHTRPVTPEYLELRAGRLATLLLPQGLPFHQRHGGRMLDMVLVPPGETGRSFSIAVALERDHPAQTAWGMISPVIAVPVDRGPPHVGPTGWLAHLDSANLMLTSLRPAEDGAGIIARLLEIGGVGGSAALRWARNPKSADLLEPDGTVMMPLTIEGDAVQFDYGAHEWLELRIEF
jgi:hypothetical protein